MTALLLLVSLLHFTATFAEGSGHLSKKYRFSRTLYSSGTNMYQLYWSFDIEADTIAFAVNVSTSGWVGFGLSPNGQMPNSDTVIGWVDNSGNPQFHDRFAVGRYEPEIDESQDWNLTSAEEHQGYTLLEFERNLTSCDDKDLDITSGTARIIWSWGNEDPPAITGLSLHLYQGSTTINLLGGLNEDVDDTQDDAYFEIRNENVALPGDTDTLYWCKLSALPEPIKKEEHYMYKMSPVITPNEGQFVHHMVVFLCPSHPGVPPPPAEYSDDCDREGAPLYITICTNTRALGSWAVGGEDFVFPEGVSFPIGGNGSDHFVVLEIHYDNPNLASGVVDSSGMRFYYTQTPPTHRAGIMTVGHDIAKIMIIPPTADGYITSGMCTSTCTNKSLPPEGITVFANIFHTHLLGRGMKIRHYTKRDPSCNGWKELPPIDENESYDFNYQQYNILQRSRTVMPGDVIELECLYKSNRDHVTLGGDSTREEMCLSFIAYYPRVPLSVCVSRPSIPSLQNFTDRYIPLEPRDEVGANLLSRDEKWIQENFGGVDWTDCAVSALQDSARSGHVDHLCVVDVLISGADIGVPEDIPTVQCPYVPTKRCLDDPLPNVTTTPPLSCPDMSASPSQTASSVLLLLMFMLAALFD